VSSDNIISEVTTMGLFSVFFGSKSSGMSAKVYGKGAKRTLRLENVALGASILGGGGAAAAGGIAAASATTGTISAIGATIGGLAGGAFGSGVGIATGGVAAAATIPFAAAGAAIGGWAGPALALIGIGTAPVWAVPTMVAGSAVAVAGAAVCAYKWLKGPSYAE
jgi:hypothetical protein